MKSFAVVLALGLTVAVQAQDQCAAIAAKVPTCAVSCIASAASGVGCAETDFSCQCKPANDAAINSAALECVVKGCGAVTGLAVQQSASAICACAASATTTTAASSTAKTTTSAAAVATSSTTAVMSSSTAAAPASTAATSPSTTTAPIASTTAASSGAGANTPSSSPMSFTGGAIKAVVSFGGIMGAIVAIMAAL